MKSVFIELLLYFSFFMSVTFFAYGYEKGSPCKIQHTLKPSEHIHGPPQIPEPPYELKVVDSSNQQITHYVPATKYYVVLVGSVPIRAFILQPRLATKDAFIIGHLRGGEFLQEPEWEDYGIMYQSCPPMFNNSITSVDNHERYLIRAAWKADANLGPIQFYATIWQDSDHYWSQWQPTSAFILPEGSVVPLENSVQPNNIVQQKPPQETQDIILDNPNSRPAPPPLSIPISSSDSEEIENNDVQAQPQEEAQASAVDDFAHERISLKTIQSKIEESFELQPVPAGKVVVFGDRKDEDLILSAGASPEVFDVEPETDIRHFPDPTTTTTPVPRPDPCASLPCFNGGKCFASDLTDAEWKEGEVDKFFCICEKEWTGLYCEVFDHCASGKCRHGQCRNEGGDYNCICEEGYAGRNCDKQCPSYLCRNGGTCIISSTNQYICRCKPGYEGETCDNEIDECASNPCRNGATCVDKVDAYDCLCAEGWMGHKCHRPCQNIYKSCSTWKRQRQCELMRPRTNFFDLNCAVACDTCEYVNETVVTNTPIPPLLEPFIFLLGVWHTETNQNIRFPVDFPEGSSGYSETITFAVTDVPMFGTPSINFSSIAVNKNDENDILTTNGFLTIRPKPRDRLRVALTTVGNDAVTVIEEGSLKNASMVLTPVYKTYIDGSKAPLENRIERKIELTSGFLSESITKYAENTGRKQAYITKYFSKKKLFHYY